MKVKKSFQTCIAKNLVQIQTVGWLGQNRKTFAFTLRSTILVHKSNFENKHLPIGSFIYG